MCWFHGEEALSSGADCILQQRGHHHTILLTGLNTAQAGLYSLAAVNNNTEIWHSWRVNVTGNNQQDLGEFSKFRRRNPEKGLKFQFPQIKKVNFAKHLFS